MTDGKPVAVDGEAFETPVPKTSMEFVYRGSLSDGIAEMETVHQMIGHQHFTPISNGADAIARGRMLLTLLVFLPR